MKKLITLTLALLMLAIPTLSMAETIAAAEGATLTVTGSASVSLKADYAQVTVGVRTTEQTIQQATAENATTIRAVIAALVEAGVAEKDIVTSNYSVSTEYDYSSGKQTMIGYSVSNQLTVIIRDMEHIGATLDKATAAGANSIYNIEFLSTQSAEAQDEATVYAVQDAFSKAKLLAEAAGLTLGGVKSITESTTGWYTTARTYDSKLLAESVSNAILPDEATVSASVTLVFELTSAIVPAASAAVTGSYEIFHMTDSEGYFQWAQEMFPSDKMLGAVLTAENALLHAQALWSEAFEGYNPINQECTVSYDPDAGVWLIKSPLTAEPDGGTARALLRAEDGQVLAIWHSK